ncbi:MAG: hypothetical protein KA821_01480 [Chitinophagaceae bacterium]|nr:hypothetical protein [Chitinophagaceae bacterium]
MQAAIQKQLEILKSLCFNLFSRYKGKSRAVILPAILVLTLLVFTDKFSEIVSAVLAKPLLSTVHTSTLVIDIICLLSGFFVIIFFIRKGINLVRLSVVLELYVFTITFIYLFFRFIDKSRYEFLPFHLGILDHIRLTDILLSFVIGVLCYYIFYSAKFIKQYKHQPSPKEGFFTDTPIVLQESTDILGRFGYIKDLAEKILATNSPSHSFAIGVIGQWGTGKTTFLSTLEHILKKEEQIVQLRFNPWVSRNVDNITAIFFSDLAARLSKFDESLKKEVIDYSKELLQVIDNSAIATIKSFFELSAKEKELHEQYEIINASIQRLKKGIVVYIDDVDRLDKKEVVEVLRIVRNTANFGNMFFVVAFDKSYVTASVNEALINSSEKYLEKIFQLEYFLPLHPNKLIYKTELLNNLRLYVPEACLPVLDYIEKPTSTFLGGFEILPNITDYITTFRDVNRFMNVFLLNYDRIKNNIYLPDYISICLLRLKFPELYQSLYYNRRHFLTTSTGHEIFENIVGELFLRFEDKGNTDLKKTELYKYLKIHYKEFAISENDVENAVMLVHSIFTAPNSAIGTNSGRRALYNHHLTVTEASFFDRYFDFSLAGRLDQVEFDSALTLPIESLEKKIVEWNTTREVSTDLIVNLENVGIPNNQDEFEKLIKAIVYLTYLPIPQNPNHDHSYSIEDFYKKLGGKADDKNSVIRTIYKDDKEKFREFFKSLYFLYSKTGKWNFIHEFAVRLIKDYNDDFIVSHAELKELLKESFLTSVAQATELTYDLMQFYNHAIRVFQQEDSGQTTIVPEGKGIEMTNEFKKLINSSLSIFLNWNIFREGPSGGFRIGGWDKVIYGTEDAFNEIVEKHKDEPIVQEYIQFRNAYKIANHPIDFKFELLKPL